VSGRGSTTTGAYGLRLSGVDGIDGLLVEAPEHWTPIELILRAGPIETDKGWVGSRRAEFVTLSGGLIQLDLEQAQAIVTAPDLPRAEEVVHPYLSSIGAMSAYLAGEESFHAGAVDLDGGAWAIVGDREAGKSSTLAWLASRGIPVVCDDMLVLRGRTALAGPRSIDLRRDAAAALGLGDEIGVVGTRERWRLRVAAVEPELELRGWIFLEWGEELAVEPLPVSERLARLLRARAALLPPTDPTAVLELARLPGLVVRRPRNLDQLRPTLEAVTDAIQKRR
jgi:hypothetical protein